MTLHPCHQRHLQMELAGSQAGRSRAEVATLLTVTQADLAHPWSLAELAAIAHLSPSRLRQLFVEIFGMPPIVWLTLQRVRAMARTISTTDATIRQAAAEVGWRNQAHAAKQFRKLTGRSRPSIGLRTAIEACGRARGAGMSVSAMLATEFMSAAHGCDEKDVLDSRVG